MARVSTDLFNLAKTLYMLVPGGQGVNIALYGSIIGGTTGLALTSSLGRKIVRLVKRDPTKYVAWGDLQGQTDRLATDRFEQMKGALAPAAIFDRNALALFQPSHKAFLALSNTFTQNIYLLAGTTAVTWTMLSLNSCMKNGDGQTNEPCWNHLASFFYDPVMLPALATIYSAGSGTGFTLGVSGSFGLIGVAIVDLMSQGWQFKGLPTMLRGKVILLTERYQALAKQVTEDWTKIKDGSDAEAKERFIKQATLLKRREKLITLGLMEHFTLDQKQSELIITPLSTAVSTILIEHEKKQSS